MKRISWLIALYYLAFGADAASLYAIAGSGTYVTDTATGAYNYFNNITTTGSSGSLAYGDGVLYAMVNSGTYAVDPITGAYSLFNSSINSYGIDGGSLAYGNGVLYAMVGSGIYAADPQTGSYAFVNNIGVNSRGGGGLAYGQGVLYAIASSGTYVTDTATGAYNYFNNITTTGSSGSLAYGDGVLYVMVNSGTYAVDPITGAYSLFNSSINSYGIDGGSLAYGNGVLYAMVGSGIYAADPQTGSYGFVNNVAVNSQGGGGLAYQVIPVPAAAWLFVSAVSILGWMRRRAQRCSIFALVSLLWAIPATSGTLYVGGGVGYPSGLHSFDTESGTEQYLSSLPTLSTAFGNGLLYITTGKSIYAYNPDSGSTEFLSGVDVVTLTFGNGVLYAGTGSRTSDNLLTIDLNTGDSTVVSSLNALDIVYGDGQVFVAMGQHGVAAYDPSTRTERSLYHDDAFSIAYGDGTIFGSTGNRLYKIDVISGVGQDFSGFDAVTLAYGDGVLYAGTGPSTMDYLGTIDVDTGNDQFLSHLNAASLTYVAAIPIPGTLWLFGSALGLLGWMRRYRG